jgi:thioredoxin reductase
MGKDERSKRVYEHPVVVIGAGLGGIQAAIDLTKRGRENVIIFERASEFGGSTWLEVANETTKLQTEKGTYHVDYPDPTVPVDASLKTWPSKASILEMLQTSAHKHGLESKTRFNVEVTKVEMEGDPVKGGHYTVTVEDDGHSKEVKACAVLAFPGIFYLPNEVNWPGRKEFGGYVVNGYFNELNPAKLKGETCVIYGHGGFAIENVRTCLENGSKKVWLLCRHRHIIGTKVASWLVSGSEVPLPGQLLVKVLQQMYSLVNYDLMTHSSVSTNKERTYALIQQSTTFGVSDIYFLAQIYGLCEVLEDEITKLSHKCVHTSSGRSIEAGVILKCIGSKPYPEFDNVIGLKTLRGFWVNGEPLRALVTLASGVQAKNFGSFSTGPFYASVIKAMNWFIDYPEDFVHISSLLPVNKGNKGVLYVADPSFVFPTMMALFRIPELAEQMSETDKLKARKTQEAHPPDIYLAECKQEWEMYIAMFRKHGQISDAEDDVPYPYTQEVLAEFNKDMEDYYKAEMDKKRISGGA